MGERERKKLNNFVRQKLFEFHLGNTAAAAYADGLEKKKRSINNYLTRPRAI